MKNALVEIIQLTKEVGNRPVETVVPGLSMIRGNVPPHILAALYKPMIGFTIQGTKVLSIGGRTTRLTGPMYFVLPVHVPATAIVHPDGNGRPYLSIGLELDHEILHDLLRDVSEDLLPGTYKEFAACPLSTTVMDALLRMVRLTRTPGDIPALAPAYKREIFYRVLMGPQGAYLRQLGMRESNFSKIARTIRWLRANYKQPFEIGDVAAKSGMGVNTFHRQFKRATGLSPIQFQKQLRLLEARNLIAFEGLAVANAAYEVGYQSPSQFNREYSRFFGSSPARDTEKLRRLESLRVA